MKTIGRVINSIIKVNIYHKKKKAKSVNFEIRNPKDQIETKFQTQTYKCRPLFITI